MDILSSFGHLFGAHPPAGAPGVPQPPQAAWPPQQPVPGYAPDAYTPYGSQIAQLQAQLAALNAQIAQLIQAAQQPYGQQPAWPPAPAWPPSQPPAWPPVAQPPGWPPVAQPPGWPPVGQPPAWYPPVMQPPALPPAPLPMPPLPPLPPAWPPAPPQPAPQPAPHPQQHGGKVDFTVTSFNILGSSHTKAGGEHPGMASGPQRVHGVLQVLKEQHVDVAGFQEMQRDQAHAFEQLAGGTYGLYPGTSGKGRNSENSIAWRKDKFELVSAKTIAIPYFEGHTKNMPIVLLRDKQTGKQAYFINIHNPADTAKHHHQQAYRTAAENKEIALVNQLKATGLPVILTGDFNEKAEAYDRITGGTHMTAANGKKYGGIDWIFGTGVKFDHFVRRRDALVQRTTDHPVVISQAHL